MKTRRNLNDLIHVARRRKITAVSAEDRQTFAHETVAKWNRQPASAVAPDDLLWWKRASLCSLTTAVAVVIAVAAFRPAPPQPVLENPFEVVLAQQDAPSLF